MSYVNNIQTKPWHRKETWASTWRLSLGSLGVSKLLEKKKEEKKLLEECKSIFFNCAASDKSTTVKLKPHSRRFEIHVLDLMSREKLTQSFVSRKVGYWTLEELEDGVNDVVKTHCKNS